MLSISFTLMLINASDLQWEDASPSIYTIQQDHINLIKTMAFPKWEEIISSWDKKGTWWHEGHIAKTALIKIILHIAKTPGFTSTKLSTIASIARVL